MNKPICLNGEWDFMPDYTSRSPEEALTQARWQEKIRVPSSWRWSIDLDADFQPFDLFGYPKEWNQAESGLLRRTFQADWEINQRPYLVLEGVLQRYAVFLNGYKLAESSESFLPLEIDLTGVARSGKENELTVWCGPHEHIETPAGRKLLAPNGSWFAQMGRGIWQDVFLEIRPDIAINDVFIKTSTRNKVIEVSVNLLNQRVLPPKASYPCLLMAQIWDGDRVVRQFIPQKVNLRSGSTKLIFYENWPDPILWSPENPHLYKLMIELVDANGTLDMYIQRFGFRESWFEGQKFFLNGTRVNLRGDAWHYQGFAQQSKEYALNWYKLCRQTGINFVRLHAMPHPRCYLEAADEAGMLIVDESAIYGSNKLVQADHPVFLEHCQEHLRTLVRRDRNHPSVILWSMQNEMRWVDGRDGYRVAMDRLTRAIKELDTSRPVSYDGDIRLVEEADPEIISMHYNIDGTIAGWERNKPLIFGEHGPWHYISPQVCSHLIGPRAYLDYKACLEGIGLDEELFIQHARREAVTGLTPFNIVHYNAWSLLPKDTPLEWDDLSRPGPKPRRIPAHALTLNNGLVTGPLFNPNPSYAFIQRAFKPVTIHADQLDNSFYCNRGIQRSFSIYNDTEQAAEARLTFTLTAGNGSPLDSGQVEFKHQPGERHAWEYRLDLPEVSVREGLCLTLELYHSGQPVHRLEQTYWIYPQNLLTAQIDTQDKTIAYLGTDESFALLSALLPGLKRLRSSDDELLASADVLLIGKNYAGKVKDTQDDLQEFLSRGGFVLVLEQNTFAPGELTLQERTFFRAFINLPGHPAFNGLTDEDLRFWHPENIHSPEARGLACRAFNKPTQGDMAILLECGAGDFGWGGLLWTPMLEYTHGAGRLLLSQLELVENFPRLPQAAILLRNLLAYALQVEPLQRQTVGLLAEEASPVVEFLELLGVEYQRIAPRSLSSFDLHNWPLVVDASILSQVAPRLHKLAQGGARVLVFPARPGQEEALSKLAGSPVALQVAPVYQLQPTADPLAWGISAHDLYRIEKVTYTPDDHQNTVIAEYALQAQGCEPVFQDVHNPWAEFFVHKRDAEYQKVAIATQVEQHGFQPSPYAAVFRFGEGLVAFSQINLAMDDKTRRIYTRLLANLGGAIRTPLLEAVKTDADYGIEAFMGLPVQPGQDEAAMQAYFSDPHFSLNNLGEGVFGWMKRVERRDGAISLPESAHKTCYLTVFVDSELNRDPSRRASNDLPDSSIVPDLFLEINCAFKLFINGELRANQEEPPESVIKVNDVTLHQGINRLALVCRSREGDVRLNAWFKSKSGEAVRGLRYRLTLD